MILTPKANFLQSKDAVSAHARAVEALTVSRAAEIALVELTLGLSARDGSEAAANAYRIEGAKRVLNILLSLHEPPQPQRSVPSSNLNSV